MPMWREIEAQSGRTLLKENGLLFYGETDTGETVEGSIPDSKRVMQERGIAHEHLTGPEQLGAHYPHMVAKEAHEGLLEHAAGSINASAACESMMALAQSSGNWQVAANTRVDDVFVAEPGKVVIVTSAGKVLQASKVVLAAGAWTNDLLAHLGGKMDLEVWRVHWGHYEVDPEVAQKLPQWFHFAKEAPDGWDGGLYYGACA